MMASADVLKLSEGITVAAFEAQLHAIVDPEPTRFIAFKGNSVAANNIVASFKQMGLQTEVQPLGVTSALGRYGIDAAKQSQMPGNVMGYLRGPDKADELVIVGCHYDSVNWE